MSAVIVPIPTSDLEGTAVHWLPFVQSIADRAGCHLDQLVTDIVSDRVHLILAWEPNEQKALALCGVRIIERGNDRIGEIVWATGSGREHWFPLIDEIERYHKEHLNCSGMKAVARLGWKKELQRRGYRATHIVMEKRIA